MTEHHVKMARATQEESQALFNFLQDLEVFMEEGFDSGELESWVCKNFRSLGSGWRRVVSGYEVLVNNACDPSLDYLDWKPELKTFIEGDRQ